MLSYRPELTVKNLVFRTHGLELENARISMLGESWTTDNKGRR